MGWQHELTEKSLQVLASISPTATVGLTTSAPNVLAAVTQPEADTPSVKENF